ncbi:uncharacterized protein LOC123327354 [Drosophila simulans]|uniref:uncharacterized protein LOC123327354 n=1 Tax=Drosophila simulans TaxID=7240 RepID=UPI001D10D284|nr:uncharacterized protein LOC123327354 [Drosophila simulans]
MSFVLVGLLFLHMLTHSRSDVDFLTCRTCRTCRNQGKGKRENRPQVRLVLRGFPVLGWLFLQLFSRRSIRSPGDNGAGTCAACPADRKRAMGFARVATKCGSKDFPYRYGSLPRLTLHSLLVNQAKPEDMYDMI